MRVGGGEGEEVVGYGSSCPATTVAIVVGRRLVSGVVNDGGFEASHIFFLLT